MGEVFVDLLYRGLPLGSRVRLVQTEGRCGYLEMAAPMPVGTAISVEADGLSVAAEVLEVYEQTAGSERPPGMRVRLALDASNKVSWWGAATGDPRVALEGVEAATSPASAVAASSVAVEGGEAMGGGAPVDSDDPAARDGAVESADGEPSREFADGEPSRESADGEPSSELADGEAGEPGDAGETPDPPASTSEAAPRGRKRRRGSRR